MSTQNTVSSLYRQSSNSLIHYLTLALQLGLLLVLIYWFDLESRALLHLGILTFFGFSIHYFLPLRYRLPFFVLLSLLGIEVVFGFQLERWSLDGLLQGAWLIGIGFVLIGICYLPVTFHIRLVLILVVGGLLSVLRVGLVQVPWSTAIWPILGSMFMFRLIIYLYDLRHSKQRFSFMESVAYFFMLPNVCFPFFPVVDFQTFRRTYYNQGDRHHIYQTGINWIFRGIIHLILYRFLYQNFVISASEVNNFQDLLRYLVVPYLLYLRVSGQFHLIVGLLHLFGFNLPETHKLYYLASSFTDFWRRINIYWKDFMMKMFYYPAFFKLRKWGGTFSLVAATVFIFFVTWFFHEYQRFWLQGVFLFRWNDILFWSILAVFMVANVLYETKHGRRRTLGQASLPLGASIVTGLHTVGVFSFICLLWSFWTAESVGEWISVWSVVRHVSASDVKVIPMVLIGLLAVGLSATLLARGGAMLRPSFARSATVVTASALLILLVTATDIYRHFGWMVGRAIAELKQSDLNRRDFALMEKGYYENLLAVAQFNPELWQIYRTRPSDWKPLDEIEAVRWTNRLPYFEFIPSAEARHNGVMVRTNRWGMRDREYSKERPPDTYRISLLGSSYVMANGVEDHEDFETLVEDRLNHEGPLGSYTRYEILNFAVGGYSPLDHLAVLENKALEFEPNAVFYIAHSKEGVTMRLVRAIERGVEHPYDYLREVARKAGVDENTDRWASSQRLRQYELEMLSWLYRRIVNACRSRGVLAVWIYLPRPEKDELGKGPPADLLHLAKEAGFILLDLSGVWDGQDLKSLWLARWDHHPNAIGHRLIADRLYELLQKTDGIIPRRPPEPTEADSRYRSLYPLEAD